MDRRIYRGPIFDLVKRSVRRGGRRVRLDVILHPGAVAIVPMLPRGRVAMIRQWRGSVGEVIYEIPAGGLKPRERPDRAARRELIEEVGLRPGRLRRLASVYSAPGFVTEKVHIFLATRCREVPAAPEPDEFIERVDMPLSRALRMIGTGEICDAKTVVGLQLAARR